MQLPFSNFLRSAQVKIGGASTDNWSFVELQFSGLKDYQHAGALVK